MNGRKQAYLLMVGVVQGVPQHEVFRLHSCMHVPRHGGQARLDLGQPTRLGPPEVARILLSVATRESGKETERGAQTGASSEGGAKRVTRDAES